MEQMNINNTVLQSIFLNERYFNKCENRNNLDNLITYHKNKIDVLRGILKTFENSSYKNKHNKKGIYIYNTNDNNISYFQGDNYNIDNYVNSYIKKNNILNYILCNRNTIDIYINSQYVDSYKYINKALLYSSIKQELKEHIQELKKYKALHKLQTLSNKHLNYTKYKYIIKSLLIKSNIPFYSINFKVISIKDNLFSIDYKFI